MRHLLAGTCLTPVMFFAVAGTAQAERAVTTQLTTPLSTSTATNGQPDDIRVANNGSIVLTSGTAITIDSDNDVKNDGKIEITTTGTGTGILAQAGRTGDISMATTGTIDVVETYTPTDTDNDGDLDGRFAVGSNRYGIRIAPGGTYTGSITTAGKILVEGNNSAGLLIESTLQGGIHNSGAIGLVGDNGYGIRANDVTGNALLRGTIAVLGENSVGIAMDGDIGGALTIQGTVTSTGYRYTTPPTDTSKLDADDLLQGGSAVRIAGNVAGGVIFAKPPPDLDDDDADEDDDGIPDAQEGTATITTYGAAPAVQIGSATETVTIGAVAGNANGHGLVIDGVISGQGLYAGVDGNGLVVGGLGGAVNVAGGMTIAGGVGASSVGGNATAVRIADGATVNQIRVSGQIQARGGGDAPDRIYGILIEDGATVTQIVNSGVIEVVRGESATSGAIVDRSGGVTSVANTGTISATGGSAQAGANVAIDLSANNAGATVSQGVVSANTAAPRIVGDILFGGGNNLLDIDDGGVLGTTRFGGGDDRLLMSGDATYLGTVQFGAGADRLLLEGTSSFVGTADFGGGADRLDIGDGTTFSGELLNSAGLAVTVNGGAFRASNDAPVALSTLAMTGDSVLGVGIDGAEGTSTLYNVAGAASFGTDTSVLVRLSNISESEGRYVFLEAGSITGASNLEFNGELLPILFKGSIDSGQSNEVAVVIERKTATELNLNRSAASAYDAIFASLDNDEDISSVFLAIRDEDALHSQFSQMLPDHAGGVFETVSLASRAAGRFLTDPWAPIADYGSWGYWIQQVGWGTSKDIGDTAAYDVTGWGASAGAELITGGAGNFGLSLAYGLGRDADGENDNEVRTEQFELAGYWRVQWGGLRAHARASAALVNFDSTRNFIGTDEAGDSVTRQTRGSWKGQLYSVSGGLSYEVNAGRLSIRPAVLLDHYRLSEDGYGESGGGEGFDLVVEDRSSNETAATASVTAGLDFGDAEREDFWMRAELEGGRRQILSGEIGATTARFGEGDEFTLLPEERTDGWMGALRLMGGSGQTKIGGEVLAEEQNGRAAVAFRASLHFGF